MTNFINIDNLLMHNRNHTFQSLQRNIKVMIYKLLTSSYRQSILNYLNLHHNDLEIDRTDLLIRKIESVKGSQYINVLSHAEIMIHDINEDYDVVTLQLYHVDNIYKSLISVNINLKETIFEDDIIIEIQNNADINNIYYTLEQLMFYLQDSITLLRL